MFEFDNGMRVQRVTLDVPHFAAWLASQPPDESYCYYSSSCSTARYFKAHGFTDVFPTYDEVSGVRADGVKVVAKLPIPVARALSELGKRYYGVAGETRFCEAANAVGKLAA